MAKRKAVMGTADDIVLAAARNLTRIVMTEAKLHVEKEGFDCINDLTEDSMKKLAVLGRALLAFGEELTKEKSPLNEILVGETMEEVLSNATEVPEDMKLDEDDVTEEYVPNPNHIDPMFG